MNGTEWHHCTECGAPIAVGDMCDHAGAPTDSFWSDMRERREARDAAWVEREAALREAGRTTGEGEFAGCVAPSGAGEASEGVGTIATPVEYSAPEACTPWAQRALYRRVRLSGMQRRAREYRRSVMAQARLREAERREALQAVEACKRTPRESGWQEWQGADIRTLTALAENGWTTADVILRKLEGAYHHKRRATREALSLMAPAYLSRDGRGTAPLACQDGRVERAEGVNGTEVRVAERWQGSTRRAIRDRQGQPYDWRCWQTLALADGLGTLRREFKVERQQRSRASATTARSAHIARMQMRAVSASAVHDARALADGTA
jgi:hypothetical protein